MRSILAVLTITLLSGCSSPGDAPIEPDDDAGGPAAPQPVEVHDVLNLVEGAQQSWTFDLAPGAKEVAIRFFVTGKVVVGAGLPLCFTWDTPSSQDATGVCQGTGAGNLQVTPYFNDGEETLYANDLGAVPGRYMFQLDAQPSTTDFHAQVTITY